MEKLIIAGREFNSRLFLGTYGIRLLLLRLRNRVKDGIGHVHAQFRQSIRGRRCVYLMLGVVVCFGMVYFSYGAFHDYSYGFGDMYRHHSWIYGLLNGTPFYEGIYPEAMHCFIYAMRVLFGVKIYSSQLFLAGIHVAVFLVSAYLLLKELFAWDGTAVLALALFLTVDLLCIDEIFSMSRLQWTLPQEFGLHAEALGAELELVLALLAGDIEDRLLPADLRTDLQQQRGFADARCAAHEHERPAHRAAAQHPVQLEHL